MIDFTIKKFLWNFDENKSDKIWGYVEIEGKVYNFWGRRADIGGEKKKLFFKRWNGRWASDDANNKAREKIRRGYDPVDVTQDNDGNYPAIEACYEGFVVAFQKQLMFARLTGDVLGEEL